MLGWGLCSQWRSSALFLKNGIIPAGVLVSIPPLTASQDVPFQQREGGAEDKLKVNVLLVCLSSSDWEKRPPSQLPVSPVTPLVHRGSLISSLSEPPGRRWSLWSPPSSPRHLHPYLYSAFGSSSSSDAGSADPDPLLGLRCVCSPALRFPRQLCPSRRVGVPGEDVSQLQGRLPSLQTFPEGFTKLRS